MNIKNEQGITLIKLIIIVVAIVTLGVVIFAFINKDENNNLNTINNIVDNNTQNAEQNTTSEDSNNVSSSNITTFADPEQYKIGDIITPGTITIGFIEMSDIDIKYPIASKVTTDPALAYSPAYLYGPGINKPGRTVIVGMLNSFKGIDKLEVDSEIILTDDENIDKIYKITEIKETTSSDSSYMKNDNTTNCELVLSLVYNDNTTKRLSFIAEEL